MKGFTLVEVLVVMAITVVMAGLLLSHFNRSSVDLTQTRVLVMDAIREAQSLALAGSVYSSRQGSPSTYRCGYGIHFDKDTYTIYAGPDAVTNDCSSLDRNYDPGEDDIVRTGIISNTDITIRNAPDIFFEPPKPTTYIDNSSDPGSADVTIVKGNAACPSADCRIINVTTSGLITAQ